MKETGHKPSSLKSTLGALYRSDIALALLLFILALASRSYFVATHPNYNGLITVRGVPYSDGQYWTLAAIKLSQGYGLGSVYRPFYSIVLGFFFIWTDWSFTAIAFLNVFVGAVTAAFLYLSVRLSFNRCVGFTAAMFFAFDPSQIIKAPEAATEPLGLLFFVLSVYFMLETGRPRTVKAVALSGVFFGLSNLTRPLTLFCAPAYAAALLVFEWAKVNGPRWALVVVSVFVLGIGATMAPWLIRQKVVHNIWSVSTNMGEALYAATSPEYKTWSRLVRLDADRAGVKPTVGGLYAFYMQKSVEHIRTNPAFYLRQTSAAFWDYLNCFDLTYRTQSKEFASRNRFTRNAEAQLLFIFTVAAMLLLVGLWKMKTDIAAGALFLLVSSILIVLWRILPSWGNFVILLAGFTHGLASGKSRGNVLLLALSLGVTGLAGAMFNNPALFRAVLMTDWLFASFYLAAFFYTARGLTSVVLRAFRKSEPSNGGPAVIPAIDSFVVAFESRVKAMTKVLTLLIVLLASVSATKLVLANLGTPDRPTAARRLSEEQKAEILAKLRTLSPSLDEELPSPAAVRFYVPPSGFANPKRVRSNPEADALIGVETAIMPYFVHYFPEGTDFKERVHVFKPRPFAYSMFRLGRASVIFPGRISRELSGQPVIAIGKMDLSKVSSSYPFAEMQCEAIIPLTSDKKKQPDYEHILLPAATPRARSN